MRKLDFYINLCRPRWFAVFFWFCNTLISSSVCHQPSPARQQSV